ncbi:Hypp9390 [Branchiostoma lanceolatum]|uniref:Hypp9390 protein n=1 Tax=Branchiostoma lanceolatum TaxID=7740 RepID=A0A8S4MLS8_BRALA|nr:Hypp9390 [Branchiostoma lanceolatum]
MIWIDEFAQDVKVESLPEATGAQTPAVEATGTQTPDVEATGAQTPDVEATGAQTPDVEATGAKTPAVEATGAKTPAVEATGAKTPAVEATGRQMAQALEGSCPLIQLTKQGLFGEPVLWHPDTVTRKKYTSMARGRVIRDPYDTEDQDVLEVLLVEMFETDEVAAFKDKMLKGEVKRKNPISKAPTSKRKKKNKKDKVETAKKTRPAEASEAVETVYPPKRLEVGQIVAVPYKERLFVASELRAWLLFYSLPIMLHFLPTKYYENYALLVTGLYILLKNSITEAELQTADDLLKQFVEGYGQLYEADHKTPSSVRTARSLMVRQSEAVETVYPPKRLEVGQIVAVPYKERLFVGTVVSVQAAVVNFLDYRGGGVYTPNHNPAEKVENTAKYMSIIINGMD